MSRFFAVLLAALVLWAPIRAQAEPATWGGGAYANPYESKSSYKKKRKYGRNKKYWKKSGYKNKRKYGKKKYSRRYKKKAYKKVMTGGGRPYIAPKRPKVVKFRKGYGRGNIVIDTAGRKLYYVLGKGKAYRYPIAVGRPGFSWTGTKRITAKRNWPDWRPPKEMRQRQPHLPELMKGGVNNPLGAKALYLGSSLYRIHGTNNLASIGTASSSGCFRMANSHVTHLSGIAKVGTKVHVVRSLYKKRKGKRRYSKRRYRKAKRS